TPCEYWETRIFPCRERPLTALSAPHRFSRFPVRVPRVPTTGKALGLLLIPPFADTAPAGAATFSSSVSRWAELLSTVTSKEVDLAFLALLQSLAVNPISDLPIDELNQRLELENAPACSWIVYAFHAPKVWLEKCSQELSCFLWDRFFRRQYQVFRIFPALKV